MKYLDFVHMIAASLRRRPVICTYDKERGALRFVTVDGERLEFLPLSPYAFEDYPTGDYPDVEFDTTEQKTLLQRLEVIGEMPLKEVRDFLDNEVNDLHTLTDLLNDAVDDLRQVEDVGDIVNAVEAIVANWKDLKEALEK